MKNFYPSETFCFDFKKYAIPYRNVMKRFDIILKRYDIILKRYDILLKRYDIILKCYDIILKHYDIILESLLYHTETFQYHTPCCSPSPHFTVFAPCGVETGWGGGVGRGVMRKSCKN
jgi:hypothetical protein